MTGSRALAKLLFRVTRPHMGSVMRLLVIVLAACAVVGAAHAQDVSKSARTDAGLTGRGLGVWKRFICCLLFQ